MKPKPLQPGDTCPTCHRIIGPHRAVKVCHKCKKPMGRGDKFHFTPAGTIEHRNCQDPARYT